MKKIILFILILVLISGNLLATPPMRVRAPFLSQEFDAEDVKAEIKFGKELAAKILKKYPPVNNSAVQNYLNKVGAGVASFIGRPELNYHFAVLNTDHVNAYACPGGYIFITKGLLRKMKNEGQLVGVISHEIGHVNYRHVVKELGIKGSGGLARAAGALIGGSTQSFRAAFGVLLDRGFKLLFDSGLSQENEYEADNSSVEAMLTLNYDLKNYGKFLLKLGKQARKSKHSALKKTHPPMRNRIKKINQAIKAIGFLPKNGKIKNKRFVKNVRI